MNPSFRGLGPVAYSDMLFLKKKVAQIQLS